MFRSTASRCGVTGRQALRGPNLAGMSATDKQRYNGGWTTKKPDRRVRELSHGMCCRLSNIWQAAYRDPSGRLKLNGGKDRKWQA